MSLSSQKMFMISAVKERKLSYVIWVNNIFKLQLKWSLYISSLGLHAVHTHWFIHWSLLLSLLKILFEAFPRIPGLIFLQ